MDNKVSQKLSNKIVIINFVLSILVVSLHTNFTGKYDPSACSMNGVYVVIKNLMDIIGDMAVPCFFIMSGLLFFRNFEYKDYGKKLLSRVFTLVIPYLIWNVVLLIYEILKTLLVDGQIALDFGDVVLGVLLSGYNGPLWFLRTLFLYTLFAPLLLLLLKVLKKYSILLVIPVILLNIFVSIDYTSVVFWFPCFFLGAYVGYYYFENLNQLTEKNSGNFKIWLGILIFIIVIVLVNYFVRADFVYYLYRNFSGVAIFLLFLALPFDTKKQFMTYSFFTFCTHVILLGPITIVIAKVCSFNGILLSIGFIVAIAINVILTILIGWLFKKLLPKVYAFVMGKR